MTMPGRIWMPPFDGNSFEMKLREALGTVDGHYAMLGYAEDSIARTTVRAALTQEPTNAR